jgi:hypothetical protein
METGIQFAPYLQQILALDELISLKEQNGRRYRRAEHSARPKVNSFCIEEGFWSFSACGLPAPVCVAGNRWHGAAG